MRVSESMHATHAARSKVTRHTAAAWASRAARGRVVATCHSSCLPRLPRLPPPQSTTTHPSPLTHTFLPSSSFFLFPRLASATTTTHTHNLPLVPSSLSLISILSTTRRHCVPTPPPAVHLLSLSLEVLDTDSPSRHSLVTTTTPSHVACVAFPPAGSVSPRHPTLPPPHPSASGRSVNNRPRQRLSPPWALVAACRETLASISHGKPRSLYQ